MTHIHYFRIPPPSEGPPLGVCTECGEERLHLNYEEASKGFQRGPKPKRQAGGEFNGWVDKQEKEASDA